MMNRVVMLLLVLVIAGSAFATDRADLPKNPNAYVNDAASPANPEGQGMVVVESRLTTIYYDAATFVPLLAPGYYFDDYDYLGWGTINDLSYQFGPVNGYSYTVSASNGIYSVPGAVSTNSAFDPIIIDFDGLPVFAVGGDFFGTDFDGIPVPADVTITLNDGTTVMLNQPAVFAGFSSDLAITQLTISVADLGVSVWPTIDNFYVGQLGAVTLEASTWGHVKALFE